MANTTLDGTSGAAPEPDASNGPDTLSKPAPDAAETHAAPSNEATTQAPESDGGSPLNDQTSAATADLSALMVGLSPSQSMALLEATVAQTLGQAMHNAVLRQQADRVVSQALISAACARLLERASLISSTGAPEAKS